MNRLESIDTAKGIAMMCVIILHTSINYSNNQYVGSEIHRFVTPFFMPIFFIISGMFFSIKLPLIEFIKKKFKRLIVPFISFYTLTYLINLVLFNLNISTKNGFSYSDIFQVFFNDVFSNNVIWFLLALFWSSIFLYLVLKYFHNKLYQSLAIVLLFTMGILLDIFDKNIPLYLDTSLSVMPFLFIGYIAKNYQFLNKITKLPIQFVLLLILLSCIGNFLLQQGISLVNNSCGNPFLFIFGGSLGSIFVILVSMVFNKIPVVSYIGMNSMTVLCTHMLVINFCVKVLDSFNIQNTSIKIFLVVILVCMSMYVIVHFLRTFVPFMIGENKIMNK